MSTIYYSRQGLNQGQEIAAGWSNQANLKHITALVGTDGNPFLPVDDRNGYTPGITRRLPNGGTWESGFPIVRFTSSAITDGQIDYLVNTLLGGVESGNVTVKYHRFDSVGNADVFTANGVLNLNLDQLTNLTRRQTTYEGFVWEIVITETL